MQASTHLCRGTPGTIDRLAKLLRAGELVAAPTETVYGLAANALDASACRKIFRAKGRPVEDPLIVHIHSHAQWEQICFPNEAARKLARRFWPGPLTLVLPKKAIIPDVVTAGRDSVAVRMPSHRLFRRLLRAAGVPLAAPSANPFGYVSPTTAEHVRDGLGGKIAAILDGGATRIGVESTIVDVRDPEKVAILRPGAITAEQVGMCLGRRISRTLDVKRRAEDGVRQNAARSRGSTLPRHARDPEPLDLARGPESVEGLAERAFRAAGAPLDGLGALSPSTPLGTLSLAKGLPNRQSAPLRAGRSGQLAPGMLARHYSPRTPLRLHGSLRGRKPRAGEAFLLLKKPEIRRPGGPKGTLSRNVFWLDAGGDLRRAARRLFAMLRKLDAMGFSTIHAELAPEKGIGVAINDRLKRAGGGGGFGPPRRSDKRST